MAFWTPIVPKLREPALVIRSGSIEQNRRFNRAFGKHHDPVIAYIAGAARTMTAYLISCHFAEDDGDALVEPQELYLAGKNAVYKSKETAMAFMHALNE